MENFTEVNYDCKEILKLSFNNNYTNSTDAWVENMDSRWQDYLVSKNVATKTGLRNKYIYFEVAAVMGVLVFFGFIGKCLTIYVIKCRTGIQRMGRVVLRRGQDEA